MLGIVTYYNTEKGYGFIQSTLADENNKDFDESYFFHVSNIVSDDIGRYDEVEFQVVYENDKSYATNVEVIHKSNVPDYHRGSREIKVNGTNDINDDKSVDESDVDIDYYGSVDDSVDEKVVRLSEVLDLSNLEDLMMGLTAVNLDTTHMNHEVTSKTSISSDIQVKSNNHILDSSPGNTDLSSSRVYTVLSLKYRNGVFEDKNLLNDVDQRSLFVNMQDNKLEMVVINKYDNKDTHSKLMNLYTSIDDLIN